MAIDSAQLRIDAYLASTDISNLDDTRLETELNDPDVIVNEPIVQETIVETDPIAPSEDELFEREMRVQSYNESISSQDNDLGYLNLPEYNLNAMGEQLDPDVDKDDINFVQVQSDHNENQILKVSELLFTPNEISYFKKTPIGISEAGRFLDVEDYLPAGGFYKGYEALSVQTIANDIQEGKDVSNNDLKTFNDYLKKHMEVQLRGFTWAGGVRYYGTPMPAFIAEFMFSGGVGKVAQKATTQALIKGAVQSSIAASEKIAIGTLGYGARGAAMTVAMAPSVSRTYGQLRVNEQLTLTEQGRAILSEAEESPAISVMKAYAYTSVDVVSEMTGAPLSRVIAPLTNRMASKVYTTATSALPPKVVNGFLDAYQKIKPNAALQNVLDKAGWHGMLMELGEERVADVLRVHANIAFGESYTFDEILDQITPSKEQFLIEAGIIGGLKTASSAIAIGQNVLSKRMYNEEDITLATSTSENDVENLVEESLNIEIEPPDINSPEAIYTLESQEAFELDETKPDSDVDMDTYVEYESSSQKVAEDQVNSKLQTAYKRVAELKRLAKRNNDRFVDWILKGGQLSYDQLSSMGIDGLSLDSVNQALKGKIPRRPWIRNTNNPNTGPTQTIDQLTERYNSDFVPYDPNISTDQSAQITNEEMVDIIREFVYEQGFRGQTGFEAIMDLEVAAEILELENEIDFFSQMSARDADLYFSDMTLDLPDLGNADYNNINTNIPLETEIDLETIYADSAQDIDQELINQDIDAELRGFLLNYMPVLPQITEQDEADIPIPKIDYSESNADAIKTAWVTKYFAIDKLVSMYESKYGAIPDSFNPKLLISAYGGIIGRFEQAVKFGTFKFTIDGKAIRTGQGFKPILDIFDGLIIPIEGNRAQRKLDLNKYLIARRIQQDIQNYVNKETGEDLVGPVQERRASKEQQLQADLDLVSLGIKYGDSIDYFDRTARELYAYQRRNLELLVDSGNMSRDRYKQIIEDNPNYIPFHRVMLDTLFDKDGNVSKETAQIYKILGAEEANIMEETGILSQKQYDMIAKEDPSLASQLNDMIEITKAPSAIKGLFNKATSRYITQRLTGSQRAIKDPLYSIMQSTYNVMNIAARNDVAQSVAKMADLMPEQIQRIMPTPLRDSKNRIVKDEDGKTIMELVTNDNSIEVYVDGQRQAYEVAKPIREALNMQDIKSMAMFEKIFVTPITLFRIGTTITPDFILSLFFRDQFVAALQSKTAANPVIDLPMAISAMINKTNLYHEWQASGGQMTNYMDLSDQGIEKAYEDIMDDSSYLNKVIKSYGLKPLRDMQRAFDSVTRISIYNANVRAGKSSREASYEAREALADFQKAGTQAEKVNRYLPFFNVAIRGTDVMQRSARENPAKFALIGLSTITLPSLILTGYYLFGADEESRRAYLALPQSDKDYNWMWRNEDGTWSAVPKPYAPGYLFGTMPQKYLEWMYATHPKDAKEFFVDFIQGATTSVSPIQSIPAVAPPPLKTWLEIKSNYLFYNEGAVIPTYKVNMEPDLQASRFGSSTATLIGDKFNMSPIVVDKIIKDVLGNAGQYGLDGAELLSDKLKDARNEPIPADPSKLPRIVRRFIKQDPLLARSETENAWWDTYSIVQTKINSLREYEKLPDLKQADEYENKFKTIFDQQYQMLDNGKLISQLYRERNEIIDDANLTVEEKDKQLERINVEKNEVITESLNEFNNAIQDAN